MQDSSLGLRYCPKHDADTHERVIIGTCFIRFIVCLWQKLLVVLFVVFRSFFGVFSSDNETDFIGYTAAVAAFRGK